MGTSLLIAALQLSIQHRNSENIVGKSINTKKKLSANSNELLSDRQLEIWELLKGQCLSAKELGKLCDLNAENIRKHIQAIRKKNGQKAIENTRSRGYWRPDAPPLDGIKKV